MTPKTGEQEQPDQAPITPEVEPAADGAGEPLPGVGPVSNLSALVQSQASEVPFSPAS